MALTAEQRQQIREARSRAARERVARTDAVERVLERGRRSCFGCGVSWRYSTPNCESCLSRRKSASHREQESVRAPSG